QEKLKTRIKKVMEKFKNEKEKINLTDSDAKFMKDGRYRIDTSYNCQASLSKEQIMLSSEVITEASDRKALELMVETSEANLAHPVEEIAADAGYSSYDNYEYLEKNNKTGYVPDQNFRKDLKKDRDPYHHTQFHYDKDQDWSEPLRLDTLSLNTPCIPESHSLHMRRMSIKYSDNSPILFFLKSLMVRKSGLYIWDR
ncbi:unnamed protein product, partial [marine sediment metagenome]